jgi:ABC-type polysaccharide/polyol phosphate export permease
LKALLYLNYRCFINGVKRAFTSGRRILGLLFGLGYFTFFFLRPFGSGSSKSSDKGLEKAMSFMKDLPVTIGAVEAVIFGASIFWVFFSLMGLTSYQGRYRQADVDNLFPTPVSRRLVMVFRFIRDVLLAFLVPLVLLLFLGKPFVGGLSSMLSRLPNPEGASLVPRVGMMGYFIASIAVVAVGYAVSIWLNRPTDKADLYRKIFGWSVALFVFGTSLAFVLRIRANPSWDGIQTLLTETWMRIIFFPAHLLATVSVSPISANSLGGWVAIASFLAIGGIGLWSYLRQEDWAYEIGALSANKTAEITESQRRGDVYATLAASARQGKMKTRRWNFLERARWTGLWALFWRDLCLSSRFGFWAWFGTLMMSVPMVALVAFIPDRGKGGPQILGAMAFLLTAFIGGVSASTSFMEMLRRGDLIKPLPFPPAKLFGFEVLSKSIQSVFTIVVTFAALMIAKPSDYVLWLALLPSSICLAANLTAVMALVLVLFPDIDDPTQRGFRGLMNLLGMVIGLAPGILVGAIVGFSTSSIPLGALASMIPSLLMTWFVTHSAGKTYIDLNVAE